MFRELDLFAFIGDGVAPLCCGGVQTNPNGYGTALNGGEVTSLLQSSTRAMLMLNEFESVTISRTQLRILLNIKDSILTGVFLRHGLRNVNDPIIGEIRINEFVWLLIDVLREPAHSRKLQVRCSIMLQEFRNDEDFIRDLVESKFDSRVNTANMITNIMWDKMLDLKEIKC